MYSYEIKPSLQKILNKVAKKDKVIYDHIMEKVKEIISSNPNHYKHLKYQLKEYFGVHVGNFILVFKFKESENFISFLDFDHHDNIYKR